MENKYYGKYRAIVVNTSDPEQRGRIRVKCPKVLGDYISAWCEPCIPFAYEAGGDFHIPKVNDFVWVEFENGEPDKPIWVGSLWTIGNTPLGANYDVQTRVIEFNGGRRTMTAQGITIQIGSSTISMTSAGVINITGSSSVNVSGGTINLN